MWWVMDGRRYLRYGRYWPSLDAVGVADVRQRFQDQLVGLLPFGGTGGGPAFGTRRVQGVAQALAGGLECKQRP